MFFRRQVASTVLIVLAASASGCALIDRLSGVGEARRLQATGLQGAARIVEVWDTGITVNEDPVIGLAVEVSRADGSVYTATIPKSLVSRIDIPHFQPGIVVPVRIDPADESIVALDVYRYGGRKAGPSS
jgi:hypothetical protein